jgi:hypothetical protein
MTSSYHYSLSKRFFFINAIKRVTRWAITSAIVISAMVVVARCFFSHYPIERMQGKFTRLERIQFGASQYFKALYLTLTAPEDNPSTTKLPVMELFVAAENLSRVTRTIPPPEDLDVPGFLKFGGDTYRVKVKMRGDSINHWSFPSKSWRIKLRRNKTIFGVSTLNLTVPRMVSQMENWFGYELGAKAGLVTPRSQMVHFRLNRKFDGIRLLVEQANDSFLRKRGVEHGTILTGDITTEQIYGSKPRPPLFDHPEAWEILQDGKAVESLHLNKIKELIHQTNFFIVQDELPKVLAVEEYAKFLAFLQIVGTNHVDDTHNQKFYVDPADQLLHPIVWDTVSYSYANIPPFDNDTSALARLFLSVPKFREMKDKALWQYLKGELSTNSKLHVLHFLFENMKHDALATPLKIAARARGIIFISNEEWLSSISKTKGERSVHAIKSNVVTPSIEEIMTRIDVDAIKSLSPVDLAANIVEVAAPAKGVHKYDLVLRVSSRAGAIVNAVTLRWSKGGSISRVVSKAQEGSLSGKKRDAVLVQKGELVTLHLKDHLYSDRLFATKINRGSKIAPMDYVYELQGGTAPEIVSIDVVHPHSGRALAFRMDEKLKRPDIINSWWDAAE